MPSACTGNKIVYQNSRLFTHGSVAHLLVERGSLLGRGTSGSRDLRERAAMWHTVNSMPDSMAKTKVTSGSEKLEASNFNDCFHSTGVAFQSHPPPCPPKPR